MNKILFEQFQKTDKYSKIIENYKSGKNQLIQGVNEESMGYLLCNLLESTTNKILLITSNEAKSRKYEEVMKAYTDNGDRLHPKEFLLYNVDALSKDTEYKRAELLDKIIHTKKSVITASINSVITRVMPKDRFKNSVIELKYGNSYDLNELRSNLINLKYERVDALEGVGQFSVRGGIIDIFSPSEPYPVRIEFFDDEIDSIRSVDLKTQRSVKNLKSVRIIPCSDLIFQRDEIKKIVSEIDLDYQKRLGKLKDIHNSKEVEKKLKVLYNSYQDKLSGGLGIENADLLVPFIKDNFVSVLDYFNDNFLLVLDEPERIFEELKNLNESFQLKYGELFEKGEIFTKQSSVYINEQELKTNILGKTFISVNGKDKIFETQDTVSLLFKEAPSYYGKMEDLSKDLNRLKYKGYKVAIILSSNEGCWNFITF